MRFVLPALALVALACSEPTSPPASSESTSAPKVGADLYSSGGWGGEYGDRNRPSRAVSYINPDIGAATANPDVNANSSCFSPDQYDTQKLSPAGTTTNNVHNDACFFGRSSGSYGGWSGGSSGSDTKVDGIATFDSYGAGVISACPDPDNAGPKTATLIDRNGDGRFDRCIQTGYQEKGIAGDKEFHARLNNTTAAGTQTVVWCYDPEKNGCGDSYIKSTVRVNWVQ